MKRVVTEWVVDSSGYTSFARVDFLDEETGDRQRRTILTPRGSGTDVRDQVLIEMIERGDIGEYQDLSPDRKLR